MTRYRPFAVLPRLPGAALVVVPAGYTTYTPESALTDLAHGLTVSIVSATGRPETFAVFQDGRLAEYGTAAELLHLDGIFARAYRAWQTGTNL
ncbi:ABC transporter ATP-binding protein [Nocardia flavorosea]|uniref:ABC transporter ATP-binding protein n=1 Tax=Nocardia flavorosea TaxID=53429 RepID=A0A846YHM9_9NOCA|nr:ABC transporter ATP-binding protein [Nocardia flavorosea]NKY58315.1 ABC transporter ATP-binding protein [Nocardia flavorosea]